MTKLTGRRLIRLALRRRRRLSEQMTLGDRSVRRADNIRRHRLAGRDEFRDEREENEKRGESAVAHVNLVNSVPLTVAAPEATMDW